MTAEIIDGKAIARQIRKDVKAQVAAFRDTHGFPPGLAVIIVGNDPASRTYVNSKKRACKRLGLHSEEYCLPESTTQSELLALVHKINNDSKIHGLLIQRPLPSTINTEEVTEAIVPEKDVDCFHSSSLGHLIIGDGSVFPCTPLGVINLLESIDYPFEGSKAVVVGRSNIVGKPVAMMLLERNCTVTICHSKTLNLADEVRSSDLVIAAVGRLEMIKGSWLKNGATVIDVGINAREDGTIAGDVDFASAVNVAKAITPVPGGVGPMTIAMLMKNTLALAKKACAKDDVSKNTANDADLAGTAIKK